MARPLRIDIPDGVYHVTSRGLERRKIVRDDRDRRKWGWLLGETAGRRDWRVLAWALMDNHFHLFLRTPRGDLSDGMHDLNSGYASAFNRRHGRHGVLFQGRYKGILVESGFHYWELSRYIHLNPVRARLVARPDDYPWSSCRAYLGRQGPPAYLAWQEVLCLHGRTVRAARAEYRRFLAEGMLRGGAHDPLAEAVGSTLLGSEGFVARMRRWLQGRMPDPEIPAAKALRAEPSVEQIEQAVCDAYGVSADSLRVRGRQGNHARAVAVYLCKTLTRRPLAEIGAHFGGVGPSSVCNVVSGITKRRRKNRRLDAELEAIGNTVAKNEE